MMVSQGRPVSADGKFTPSGAPSYTAPGAAFRLDFQTLTSTGMWVANNGSANVVVASNQVAGDAPLGSVLTAESAPVVLADIPAARRLTMAASMFGSIAQNSSCSMRFYALGAAASGNCVMTPYFYEAFLQKWVAIAQTAVTLTAGAVGQFPVVTVPSLFIGALVGFVVTTPANAQYAGFGFN